MLKLLITLATSYHVHAGYSAVNYIRTKKRNASKISEEEEIRLIHTKVEPNIRNLISKHQP